MKRKKLTLSHLGFFYRNDKPEGFGFAIQEAEGGISPTMLLEKFESAYARFKHSPCVSRKSSSRKALMTA
jgi:hypothetical protein